MAATTKVQEEWEAATAVRLNGKQKAKKFVEEVFSTQAKRRIFIDETGNLVRPRRFSNPDIGAATVAMQM